MSPLPNFRLDGEVALITGAASGIGREVALAAAASGAAVALLDLPSDGLNQTLADSLDVGVDAVAYAVDVTDTESVNSAVEDIPTRLGQLTLAVNSAGIADSNAAEDLTDSQFQRMYDINVHGLFRACRAEGRAMLAHRRGAIVNIASISGLVSHREMMQAHYNSAKAAVTHLSRSLATEWADRGIRVNAVSPGFTLTPMNRRPEVADMRSQLSASIPLGRFADPTEIVGPVLFLLSGASSYCTGADLVVDGGYTAL